MITKKIMLSLLPLIIITGCNIDNSNKKTVSIDNNAIKTEALATYYNLDSKASTSYFTKQIHKYDVDSLKMKASAIEPNGEYTMSFSGSAITFSDEVGKKYWSSAMAKLLVTGFALSGGYTDINNLELTNTSETVRIQGILYNIHKKNTSIGELTVFTRLSDGVADRLQIQNGEQILSAFSYNRFYEAKLGKVVAHNIDIYTGDAASIDTKLIYSVKYISF